MIKQVNVKRSFQFIFLVRLIRSFFFTFSYRKKINPFFENISFYPFVYGLPRKKKSLASCHNSFWHEVGVGGGSQEQEAGRAVTQPRNEELRRHSHSLWQHGR